MCNTNECNPAAGGSAARRTILVVDDAPTSAVALELAFAPIEGVNVSAVPSALDAIRILRDLGTSICAVITDIRMPVMDGFELIQFIRGDARFAATPVIVVTADADPDTVERSLRLGASACFAKPFSPIAVRQALERFLYAKQDSE
jgi:CheY-like chemotaxis protein